jgi:hypothetical protein
MKKILNVQQMARKIILKKLQKIAARSLGSISTCKLFAASLGAYQTCPGVYEQPRSE